MPNDKNVAPMTHGFLVAVEAKRAISQFDLSDKIDDALRFMEGVTKVEIDWLGEWDETREAKEALQSEEQI